MSNKPNLGLQIALMIFVLITIALAVSTFMFFKENQEAQLAKKNAETERDKFKDEKRLADQDVDRIKTIVGKGPQDKVSTILDDFEADKKRYAATYPDPAQTYPEALSHAIDMYLKLQDEIAQKKDTIVRLENEQHQLKAKTETEVAQYKTSLNNQTAENLALHTDYDNRTKGFDDSRGDLQKKIEEGRKLLSEQETQAKNKIDAKNREIVKINGEKQAVIDVLAPYKKIDISAPAGTIVRVNQVEHTVWIDLGQADGLRPQMIFTVYDSSVSNMSSKDAKPKGTIEVLRMLDDPHMAEARITDDHITDPILRKDKIMSPTFVPGAAEHFAVAGVIDIHDNGDNDLPQLLTLIRTNGGVIDAVVDENGKRSGKLSPATKLLVLGKSPVDAKGADTSKNYAALMKEANALHIATMPLKDFLKLMGYQGREQTVKYGQGPGSVGPSAKEDDTFRKRP